AAGQALAAEFFPCRHRPLAFAGPAGAAAGPGAVACLAHVGFVVGQGVAAASLVPGVAEAWNCFDAGPDAAVASLVPDVADFWHCFDAVRFYWHLYLHHGAHPGPACSWPHAT